MKFFLIYLLIVNAIAFTLMHIDKQKARKKKWRIPEATLMGFAAIGGSIGALVGMYTFRHKTLHKKFTLGIPTNMFIQIAATAAVVYWLYFR